MGNQCLKDGTASTKQDHQQKELVQPQEPAQMTMEGQLYQEEPVDLCYMVRAIHGLGPLGAELQAAAIGSTLGEPKARRGAMNAGRNGPTPSKSQATCSRRRIESDPNHG